MVIDNIDDYYFDDFEGKSIIATALRYIRSNGQVVPYEKEDLMRGDLFAEIAHGLFNSGSYVINLEKLRNENYTIDNYLLCAEMMYDIKDHIPKDYFKDQKHLGHWGDQVYWGDQGFLSLMFVGDIKYFAYPKTKNIMYMPYNFGIWYFNRSDILQYNISIIHYTGDGEKKPWYMKFPKFLKRFQDKDKLYPLDNVNPNLIDCYKIWYGYALRANLDWSNLMKTINIMTSCDGNLMKFIPIQLESIAESLENMVINFYIFHDGSEGDYVKELHKLKYKNIKLYDIVVEDAQLYDAIAKYGGGWCGAAYYSLCAWQYLPENMDRILYIDAGDVLIVGNIDEYYFADFEDKSRLDMMISLLSPILNE